MDEEKFYGRISLEKNKDVQVEYYLIVNSIGNEYCDLYSYGVKVEKTITSLGGGKTIETKQINNIFYDIDDAEKFLKLIIRNSVTPISLMEVVEDYIIDMTHKETA